MDNINVAVLIIALVFVAAGVTLIALSALVGRGTPTAPSDGDTTQLPELETPTDDEPAVLFIDEPLTTDLAEELAEPERGSRRGAAAESAPEAEASAGPEVAETRPAEAAVKPSSAANAAPAGAFDFSVQLGFKYLDNGLTSEAVAEFQRAAALTDDRATKLSLYTRIGDTLRERGMAGPAYASYLQATAYADDPDTRARLERAIGEMSDAEPDSDQAPRSSGDEKE